MQDEDNNEEETISTLEDFHSMMRCLASQSQKLAGPEQKGESITYNETK